MLSYDQTAAKKQWRGAVRVVAEAIEDAGGVANNVNDAKLDAVPLQVTRVPSPGPLPWASSTALRPTAREAVRAGVNVPAMLAGGTLRALLTLLPFSFLPSRLLTSA